MNRTELPIENPCHADWTTMTLADRGRFCGACKKVVHELARLTEAEARALLASPPTEGLCVRYVHDATGEIVFRSEVVPVARLARAKRVAATALAAATLPFAAGCMGAAMPQPVMMGAPPAMTTVATTGEPPAVPPPAASAKPAAARPVKDDRGRQPGGAGSAPSTR